VFELNPHKAPKETGRGRKRDSTRDVLVAEIFPSPENDRLYDPIDPEAKDFLELVDSVRARGVLEPLVLTLDGFILSGHRRFAAANAAGRETVPARRAKIRRADDLDGFVKLLREYNRQREKTREERLREELVTVDPDEAYQSLIDFRQRRSAESVSADPMRIAGEKCRSLISAAKAPMMAAVQRILEERREFWPLSDRQIHYALLNAPPLIHAAKHGRYENSLQCYKGLSDLLTRARIAGAIPWMAIADETRPVDIWTVHRGPGFFIRAELDSFLKGYWRDLMQSQANHVELVIEKNTAASIVRNVAMQYCIPMTSGRGYCSSPPRRAIAERFGRSGKEKLILLMVSDFDPDGEEIARSFARSMRDDFGIAAIHPVKVALTAEQVRRFNLPPVMKAKAPKSDSQATKRQKFVDEQGGDDVFEIEALPPADLQRIVREAIDSVIDLNAFNAELASEREDAAFLQGVRHRVQSSLESLDLSGFGSD
jgi:hypothetical protein